MLDVWPANCKGSVHKEGKQIVSTIPLNYVWKQQFLILKAELSAGEMFWPKREEHISAGYASDQLLPSGPTNTLAFVSWVKPFFSTTVEIQTVNTQTCCFTSKPALQNLNTKDGQAVFLILQKQLKLKGKVIFTERLH